MTTQAALTEITHADRWSDLLGGRGHLLQSWGWGQLKQTAGWRPLRLAVVGPGGPPAMAQLLVRRQLGLSVCYVPRGPVWAGDPGRDAMLMRALRTVAGRQRAIFLRVEPDHELGADQAATLRGFAASAPLQPSTSIHLDLGPEPEALLAAMSKGHRADIKRAAKKGVAVRVGQDERDLEVFYALMEQTAARAGFGIHARSYYAAAWRIFGPAGARLLLAELAGQPVAAFLVLAHGAEAQYMYSAASEAGLGSGANHLLQWEAIQWARQRGCQRYDFWGIPAALGAAAMATHEDERARLEAAAKDHPLAGVYRFKKGFGGQVVRYPPAYDYVLLRPAYWLWQRRRAD